MKKLQKIYQRTSKQTQNRIQELTDTFNFNFNTLYNIADSKNKKRINEYIEEWQDKDILKGQFGILAKNIYKRTRVKNSEILELLIYGAYIEEQNKLEETELNIMKEDAEYYYNDGINEVREAQGKGKKHSIIPEIILISLLALPNSKGYIWNEYLDAITKFNADQIYRQATIDLQQQKELDITNDMYQNIIKRQINSKLNINGDKISGDIDLTLIGINNQAKVEGIKNVDNDAKVVFLANIDGKETPMCHSLNRQEFYIDKENTFNRYYGETPNELSIQRISCKGLVLGLNLPPISHHFHWCRSAVQYMPSRVENKWKTWYNKLGNNNTNGIGGSGNGTFIEKIRKEEIPQKLKYYEEEIRNMPIEYGVLIDNEGNIYAYQGTKHNLTISDRRLDNVIITHNHPEVGSFGKDDYDMLKDNPNIKELRAVDKEYDYSLKIIKSFDMTYNEIYRQSGDIMKDTMEEEQHCVMLKLKELGYIEYDRTRKK